MNTHKMQQTPVSPRPVELVERAIRLAELIRDTAQPQPMKISRLAS